jgi:hypothetical protein
VDDVDDINTAERPLMPRSTQPTWIIGKMNFRPASSAAVAAK